MEWYNYVSGFWAGAFLANFVPHFAKGICGDKFPTPFAKPPGKGLSSPMVNTLWSLLNLIIGYVLYIHAHLSNDNMLSLIVFFTGVALMSIMLAANFAKKDKE